LEKYRCANDDADDDAAAGAWVAIAVAAAPCKEETRRGAVAANSRSMVVLKPSVLFLFLIR